MKIDSLYMWRALELARHGLLDASPNPMVGAVIVSHDGKIIGEGWHRRCGEGHAEVNAVASVKDERELRDSTMYVTLEPCAHYGKTPPCAKLIIDKGIPSVVVGCHDPFAKVSGRGIEMLREAGVEVVVGVLEEECRAINIKFMTAHTDKRPFITLKWAESADGYMDGKISTPLNSVAVHRLRAMYDAILVGSGTWLADSPTLSTRLYAGKSPRRVVLDRRGRLFTPDDVIALRDYTSLHEAVNFLYSEHGITSLLIEGGPTVLQAFLDEGLYDRIRIERSEIETHGRVKAPSLPKDIRIENIEELDNHKIINLT
ncbi:MAG: bifunctional diaminohydroxyphosphoribosylaminopyrimidine deaminase/5-amino-6-(5-phosphoribosylamino)uracil reductase RibD [Muribaculaceae bacterium]|nr:bifunctional diaminohydroxyphosphoribosylaminopyrimidine deaminase/5-amino-6-(5-phosphoribosylamino)uracil reductase RibD [Muribaculaceae bacterium]